MVPNSKQQCTTHQQHHYACKAHTVVGLDDKPKFTELPVKIAIFSSTRISTKVAALAVLYVQLKTKLLLLLYVVTACSYKKSNKTLNLSVEMTIIKGKTSNTHPHVSNGQLQSGFDLPLCEFFLHDNLESHHYKETTQQISLKHLVQKRPVQQQSSWQRPGDSC